MRKNEISEALFDESKKVIPGGVNSPVRAFKAVDLPPRFIRSGKGSKIIDEDGTEVMRIRRCSKPLTQP
jgi:glutamate-1-semialdehyde 2,1-aminomutase